MNDVERAVIDRLRPRAQEAAALEATIERLMVEMRSALSAAAVDAVPTVQGSVAKDTWIAGQADIDLFILFPPGTDEGDMAASTRGVAQRVLADARERYAQHPYVVGHFEGFEVDCVPAYHVADPTQRMSPVDRTPFHTAWVNSALDDRLRDDVRLAKQWMKGVETYGAETAIGGFSGYLVEVLVIQFGGFIPCIKWLASGAPAVGDIQRSDAAEGTLVVPDPIDGDRNCAAAVSVATLQRAETAAKAYLEFSGERYFFPQPPRPESTGHLNDRLEAAGNLWLGWLFQDVRARLDIVYPQFQKAGARITKELIDAGFAVRTSHSWTRGEMVGLQWLVDSAPLPPSRTHRGPRADAQPNADRFRAKWVDHPDALGPVVDVDGRLEVEVAIRNRSAIARLHALIRDTDFGKHVTEAKAAAVVLDDVSEVPSPWSPYVADFILGRRPWER